MVDWADGYVVGCGAPFVGMSRIWSNCVTECGHPSGSQKQHGVLLSRAELPSPKLLLLCVSSPHPLLFTRPPPPPHSPPPSLPLTDLKRQAGPVGGQARRTRHHCCHRWVGGWVRGGEWWLESHEQLTTSGCRHCFWPWCVLVVLPVVRQLCSSVCLGESVAATALPLALPCCSKHRRAFLHTPRALRTRTAAWDTAPDPYRHPHKHMPHCPPRHFGLQASLPRTLRAR
jgi:hypothetical protein